MEGRKRVRNKRKINITGKAEKVQRKEERMTENKEEENRKERREERARGLIRMEGEEEVKEKKKGWKEDK